MPQPLPFVLLNKLQDWSSKEALPQLLLGRDGSFIQHYPAQVSSQEARVWVHQLKAKITFISYRKSRADQTKRDNRTVAKAKQWNLEDWGQPDTALLQFPSIRRAVMAFIGWWWPMLNTTVASSLHHHLTHGTASPIQLLHRDQAAYTQKFQLPIDPN